MQDIKKETKAMEKIIRVGDALLSLEVPKVMGIINITPDSFVSGSRAMHESAIEQKLLEMHQAGVDIIDVGAYSTRPGHHEVSIQEEIDRLGMAFLVLKKMKISVPVSVDTFRADVAAFALEQGATIINDVSGGTADPTMFETAAKYDATYVLMHLQGSVHDFFNHTSYTDLLGEMLRFFVQQIQAARKKGVRDIILDPGFGFSKNLDQNFYLLNNLNYFKSLNLPLLVGISRKSMLYRLLDILPEDAGPASMVAHFWALTQGADILRVHDVALAKQCIRLFDKINTTKNGC